MHVNRQLNEKLDWLLEGKDIGDRVNRAKFLAEKDQTFASFMRMGCLANEKMVGIPEGMPDTYKPDTNIPDGIAETTARQEFRRIRGFLPNGSMQSVKPAQREMIWIQIMQGLHWKEANVLLHIKDQTLLDIYPDLFDVFVELGMPLVKKVETKTKKKKEPTKKDTLEQDV